MMELLLGPGLVCLFSLSRPAIPDILVLLFAPILPLPFAWLLGVPARAWLAAVARAALGCLALLCVRVDVGEDGSGGGMLMFLLSSSAKGR